MERYIRHITLDEVGLAGQKLLEQSSVLIIGAGGLGSPVLQYLCASGVGRLGVIDFDRVELSNLHRQVLFGTADVGRWKAEVAKDRLGQMNPDVKVEAYNDALTAENAMALFETYDIIVDGSDNFDTRYLVSDAAVLSGKPVVYGALYKFEGQVAVFNYQGGPSYRCAFPEVPGANAVPNCSEVGILGPLAGIIGNIMANETLKLILNLQPLLSGVVLLFNSRTNQFQQLRIKRSDSEIDRVKSQGLAGVSGNPATLNCSGDLDIDPERALGTPDFEYLDIRELHEDPELQINGCRRLPMSNMDRHLEVLNKNKRYVVICRSGARSTVVARKMRAMGFLQAYSLKGGVTAIESYQNQGQL